MTTRERWFRAPGAASLDERGLVSVAACMEIASTGQVLSTDRHSAAVHLEGHPPLFLKWRRPRSNKAWKTWQRPSRELLEARAMLGLRARGIPAPAPLAVAERRRAGLLVGAVLVRPWLDGHETAEDVLAAEAPDGSVGRGLAAAWRAWHDRGFRHGDAYPKNVLVPPGGRPPVPIGCPKARFLGPGPELDDGRLKDLAQWSVGMGLAQGRETFGETLRTFFRRYADAPGVGSPDELAARVQPFVRRILRKKSARIASRPRREPDGPPPPRPLPPDAVPVRRTFHPLA